MSTRSERKQQFLNRHFPDADLPVTNKAADYHLLALILILSLDEEVRRATFPDDGTVNPAAVFERYADSNVLDSSRVQEIHVRALSRYREAFRGVKMAWAALDNYNPEPCPAREAIIELVKATRQLPGSGV